jgi:O-antigen chain-terminating methyltransferase
LRRKLEQEEQAYAQLLAQLDALARLPPAFAGEAELAGRINESWSAPPDDRQNFFSKTVRGEMGPVVERQVQFNSAVVQLLNGHLEDAARMRAHVAQLASTLVQYLQRVLPMMDTRDRVAAGLATTRAELILEAFDRRQEAASRRLEGLLAMRDRLEALSEEVRAIRGGVAPVGAPAAPGRGAAGPGAAAADASDGALYVAFENAFRGSRDDIRERLRDYLPLFAGAGPVADLGCGRGEFLELLREAGIEGRGVEGNAHSASACGAAGLDVSHGDLLEFLRAQADGSLGGVFAAQVAEHLPPAVLQAMLREAHRALRPGGVLVLETVNPSSAAGFFDVYIRDLTHERPLHPDTLRFLAAAHGFTDVRIELRSPVDAASRLRPIPAGGLPGAAVDALNENVARLNDVLFAPREYALVARR